MSAEPRPPKPAFEPFTGLPDLPALRELKALRQWVAWDYVWRPEREKWDKPPINPRTGGFGSSTDPKTWGTYDEAVACARSRGMPGVGIVLTEDDDIVGGDLDRCVNGKMEEWVGDVVGLAETYAETSPSGAGIRILGRREGHEKTAKFDPARVEIYVSARYLTLTGKHVAGTPDTIQAAPKTWDALYGRIDRFKAEAAAAKSAEEESARASARQQDRAPPGSDDFFRTVNRRAIENLDAWVPTLFPGAKRSAGTQGYRIAAKELGRDLEEDLSIAPMGIVDFGVHDMGDARDGKRTAIDIIIEHGGAADARQAALWLCEQLRLDASELGYRAGARAGQGAGGGQEQPRAGSEAPRSKSGASQQRDEEPRRVAYQGVLLPVQRDRLEIAPKLEAAAPFPTAALPKLARDAIEALHEHVQAPVALCAQAVLGAATLAAQPLADVKVPALPDAVPLSLFFLAVAQSGERKTAVDRIALAPIAVWEADRAQGYDEAMKRYRAEKAIFDAEHKKVVANRKLSIEDKRQVLAALSEPEEPVPPLMRVKEPTFEGLINILKRGASSLGLFTSEGGQFLGGHGMNDEARIRTMTGLSELWDSGTAQRVRANEITRLDGRRVSISLAVQEKIAGAFLSNDAARDQGFIGRFLITMPETRIGEREVRAAQPLDDPRIQAFHARLTDILEQPRRHRLGTRDELAPLALTLTEKAWSAWQRFAQETEQRCGEEGDLRPIRSAALKMSENVARIAGSLGILANPTIYEIDEATMIAAVEVGAYYLVEALRLSGPGAPDPEKAALGELARWLTDVWKEERISPSLMQQRAPSALRADATTMQGRIAELQRAGVLELSGRGTIAGKSYRETYLILREEPAA